MEKPNYVYTDLKSEEMVVLQSKVFVLQNRTDALEQTVKDLALCLKVLGFRPAMLQAYFEKGKKNGTGD